ncbi:hypothetical protein AB0323_09925, partial [Arthrobacter sp. NPDC080031]
DGGTTSLANGAGLCEACNHTKELPGWTAQTRTAQTGTAQTSPGTRHVLDIRTPTGHHYQSTAPPLPGTRPTRSTDPPDIAPPHSKRHRRRLRHHAKALKYAHATELQAA